MNDRPKSPENAAPSSRAVADQGGDPLRGLQQPKPQEFDIRIAADGSWYHEGGIIGRPALLKLFASVLRREDDGSFWLVTPVERGRITVDDAPFVVTSMAVTGQGEDQQITFTTNVDEQVHLSSANPLVMRSHPAGNDLRPYVRGRGGLEACLSRPVFYELASLAVDGPDESERESGRESGPESGRETTLGVWSDGVFFALVSG